MHVGDPFDASTGLSTHEAVRGRGRGMGDSEYLPGTGDSQRALCASGIACRAGARLSVGMGGKGFLTQRRKDAKRLLAGDRPDVDWTLPLGRR
jgi:hypothetical protein